MPKSKSYTPIYGKWDCAESAEYAYEKVLNGEWDKDRFLAWHNHYVMEFERDLSADENY